jgi:hypothetical protein
MLITAGRCVHRYVASQSLRRRSHPPSTEHPYVGNAIGWSNVLVTAGEVKSKPLSWLARQVRKAINEQGTRAQHEAYYEMVRASGTGLPIVIMGDRGMAQVGSSNWAKAGLFDLDFAPARTEATARLLDRRMSRKTTGLLSRPTGSLSSGRMGRRILDFGV